MPLGVKDLEDAEGFPTTHGSPLEADAAPASRDSHLVARLRRAGCVVVGKTNTPEYGWTACTTNAVFGFTRNPWNLDRSAGGSSGGSAAAIAAGMVPLATGSDGGGSIRIPSALCGLSGFKPSFGRVPAGGAAPPGWLHFSSKGPMARSHRSTWRSRSTPSSAPSRTTSTPCHGPRRRGSSGHRPEAARPRRLVADARLRDGRRVGAARRASARSRSLERLGVEVVELPSRVRHRPGPLVARRSSRRATRATSRSMRDHPRYDELHPQLRAACRPTARRSSGVELVRAYDEFHRMNLRLVELFRDVRLLVTPTTAAVAPHERDGILGMVNGVRRRPPGCGSPTRST